MTRLATFSNESHITAASGKRAAFAKDGLSSYTVTSNFSIAATRTRGRATCPPPNTNMRERGMKRSTMTVCGPLRLIYRESSVPRLSAHPAAASPVCSMCAAPSFEQVVTMMASSPRLIAWSIWAYMYRMASPPSVCLLPARGRPVDCVIIAKAPREAEPTANGGSFSSNLDKHGMVN